MLGFPGGSAVKNLPANAGDAGPIPGWSHRQRSLAGYSLWNKSGTQLSN